MTIRQSELRAGAHGGAGGASVLVLAVGVTVILIGLSAVWLGGVMVARHRAAGAADAGALAGARHVLIDEERACAAANRLVIRNSGSMVSCQVNDDLAITISVEVELTGALARWRTATATARAGPVQAVHSR